MEYPTELDLLDFFEVEPVTEGDVCFYRVIREGSELIFSFDPYAHSVQVEIRDSAKGVSATWCSEGLERMWFRDGVLHAAFSLNPARSELTLQLKPSIAVSWSALRQLQ